MTEWAPTRLGHVTTQVQDLVKIAPGEEYPLLGVKWYAEGPFLREVVTSETSKATRFYRVRPGQFIYNRLFAWKGSFGLVGNDLAGSYVSNEFPLFDCDRSQLLPEFLNLYFGQQSVWKYVERVSTGTTASRSRWKESQFNDYELILPSPAEQRRIVDVMAAVDAQVGALVAEAARIWRAQAAAREEFLAGAPLVPLTDVCDVRTGLVDPRLDEYADLIHVGVDSMERRTGRIVGARTARQDGLISGKYLFEPGDVIYAKIRPILRKVSAPDFSGLCSADAYPLRPLNGVSATLLRESLLFESVVEEVVKMSGRTKMPKVNRKELFSVTVPMPDPSIRDDVDAALLSLRSEAEGVETELANLRAFRSNLLTALLSQEIEIPESYDALLEPAISGAS